MPKPLSTHMQHGVMPSKVFVPHGNTLPLLEFLSLRFAHISHSQWQQRFADQLIIDSQGLPLHNHSIVAGVHIYYYRQVVGEPTATVPIHILAETEHLLVLDKPHNVVVAPTGQYVQATLLTALKAHTGNAELSPLHRLDRETAGVMLFCKTPRARAAYHHMFSNHTFSKTYHAITAVGADFALPYQRTVTAHLQRGSPFYTMEVNPALPSNSQTHVTAVSLHQHQGQQLAKFSLQPISGKMHQLRVHMHLLGMPLLNDTLYPNILEGRHSNTHPPLQLLAASIAWQDPFDGQTYQYDSQQQLIY